MPEVDPVMAAQRSLRNMSVKAPDIAERNA
jgi:hypothetical protein